MNELNAKIDMLQDFIDMKYPHESLMELFYDIVIDIRNYYNSNFN